MDFQSAMETFAEAWVAANAGHQTQALALTCSKSPSSSDIIVKKEHSLSPPHHTQLQQNHQPTQQLQQQQQPQLQIARDTQSASSTSLSSVGGGGGDGGGGGGGGNSIAGGGGGCGGGQQSDKNQAMYSMKLHLNQMAQHNQNQPMDHESPSPHYARRSAEASPVPSMNDHAAAAAAAAAVMASSQSGAVRPLAMSIPKIENPPPLSENGPVSGGGIVGSGMGGSGVIGGDKMKTSPSMERRDFDMTKANARVRLHCIVESVHSLQASLSIDARNVYKRRPNIEKDCYVILEAATLWTDIVSTTLYNLGYSLEVASTARGSLIIKTWKPIPLENISDNPVVQLSDILGELASVVTLRIVILRRKHSTFCEIKDKLLQMLVLQSHSVLRSTGCPLDEVTLSRIYRNSMGYTGEISDDLRRKFDQWYNQVSPQTTMAPKIFPFMAAAASAGAPHHQPSDMDFNTVSQVAAAAAAARSLHHTSRDSLLGESHQPPPPPPHHLHPSMIVHPVMHPHPMHPHASYPTNQKTRMRTSFDPEMELPKLQKWFQENPHPSRQQIQTYVMQLNSLESRRGRKPLDVNNVVYWFKNARAAQKRAEMRGGVGQMTGASTGGTSGPFAAGHPANGYLNHHHHAQQMMSHDYLKSPMSLKSDDIDTMSQHSDDMDDDQSRPISPQLPLSLTMHERNRSPEDERSSMGKEDVTSNHNGSTTERNSRSASGGNNEDLPNGNTDRHSDVENQSQHGEANNNSSSNNNNKNSSSNRSLDERCESPKHSPKSEDLDMDDDNDTSQMEDFRTPSPDNRKDNLFPMVPNAMFSQSLMYMTQYMPGFVQPGHPHHGGGGMHPSVPMGPGSMTLSNLSSEERRKRNRTFIDPVTEVPKLEHWFLENTHPSHNLILKYTEDLNTMPYRQKFPRLESKNVQFWFKNRRAKNKRLNVLNLTYDSPKCAQLGGINTYVHKYDERD